MRKPSLARQLLIGLLLGALLMPTTAQAQWTVYDPAQYALQVKKKIDEATRWLETVRHYAEIYEKAAQQVTTLGGILKTTEDLVAKQRNMIATMSNIGQTVRGAYQLKNQLETLVTTRLRAIKAINDRLRNGIFDPEADLRDFEEYLRDSIGRSSQDTVANLERLARMDNQLERLQYELKKARRRQAEAEEQKIKAYENLNKELAKPESERCASCIASLNQEMSNYEIMIGQLDSEIVRLQTEIETRVKKYNVVLEERVNFGQQVQAVNQAWTEFNGTKDEVQKLLNQIEGRNSR
jgi:predicted  nucleic acid-binding Zn-ribbon protein